MADSRPLPAGWIAQFDNNYQTNFYVNTSTNPPETSWIHPLDQPPKAPAYTAPAGPPPSHAQGVGSPALYPNEKQGYTGQEQYHQHQGPAQYGVTSPGVYGGVPPSPHGVRSGDTYGGQSGDHYGQYQQQGYGGGFQQQPPQKQGFLSKLGLGGSKNKQQSHPNYGGYPQQQMMHNGGMMGGGMQGQPMYGQQRRGGGGLGAGGGMALGLGAGMLGGMMIGNALADDDDCGGGDDGGGE